LCTDGTFSCIGVVNTGVCVPKANRNSSAAGGSQRRAIRYAGATTQMPANRERKLYLEGPAVN
jgi:hypothetical protein